MWHSSDIGLYGFSMSFNCLHNLGTLFAVKHLWSISSSQLCKVGPRLFCCFTSTLSMPAALLFLGALPKMQDYIGLNLVNYMNWL